MHISSILKVDGFGVLWSEHVEWIAMYKYNWTLWLQQMYILLQNAWAYEYSETGMSTPEVYIHVQSTLSYTTPTSESLYFQTKLEQLERLRSEIYPLPPIVYPY